MVVPNIKDINFWDNHNHRRLIWLCCSEYQWYQLLRQFTTNITVPMSTLCCSEYQRYQLESNSQLALTDDKSRGCSAIKDINLREFTTHLWYILYQKLNIKISTLRAIHNNKEDIKINELFRNIKDINFESNSQQLFVVVGALWVVRISKISTFESNSHTTLWVQAQLVVPNIKDINFEHPQLHTTCKPLWLSCSEYQRYQLLRAIHNHLNILKMYVVRIS